MNTEVLGVIAQIVLMVVLCSAILWANISLKFIKVKRLGRIL